MYNSFGVVFSGTSVHGGGWNAQRLFALVGGLRQWFCKTSL